VLALIFGYGAVRSWKRHVARQVAEDAEILALRRRYPSPLDPF
jgi:hypothetical protein